MKRGLMRSGPVTMSVGGKTYSRAAVVILFRCEECLGELVERNAGVCCEAAPAHRGLVHRDVARAVLARQAEEINELSKFYHIEDGKVVINANQGLDR